MFRLIGWLVRPGRFRRWVNSGIRRVPSWGRKWLLGGLVFLFTILPLRLNQSVNEGMKAAFPSASFLKRFNLRRGFWKHGFQTLYELMLETPETGIPWHRISSAGLHHLDQALQQEKGAVIYSLHTGNFFYAYAYLAERYPCLTVATASGEQLKPIFDLFKARGYRGYDYDQDTPFKMMNGLRKHLRTNGVVFLLGDFYRPEFPDTRLFGRANAMPAGVVELTEKTGAPVVPLITCRDEQQKHRILLDEPFRFDPKHSKAERLQQCAAWQERMIRLYPDQWLYWFQLPQRWLNRRTSGGEEGHADEKWSVIGTVRGT